MEQEKDRYFMQVALEQAQRALDRGEFPVGCVVVYQDEIVASGRRVNSRQANELDHAEICALRELWERHPAIGSSDLVVYSTLEPCLMCFATILVNGIRRVVYGFEDVMGGGTSLQLSQLPPLYRQMQVTVTGGLLRGQCLELLKNFFSNPANRYLHDSLLARHILSQP
jgi:tRNA(adenine34) deaminase